MENMRFLVLAAGLCTVVMQGCTQEPTTLDSKVYESCCGIEPVEYKVADAYMYVPNVFTPNGDGVNDYFVPYVNRNVLDFDSYLIYTGEGDTVLFARTGFDYNFIPTYAWDGNRLDGTPYIGAFRYEFYTFLKDNGVFIVKGRACRVECGRDASFFQKKEGCFYPNQSNAEGLLDSKLPNKEGKCFE
jgi:hypothetical protein